MKRKDFKALREKDKPALVKDLLNLKQKLIKSRLNKISQKAKNVRTNKTMRQDIAKIATLIREWEIKEKKSK